MKVNLSGMAKPCVRILTALESNEIHIILQEIMLTMSVTIKIGNDTKH